MWQVDVTYFITPILVFFLLLKSNINIFWDCGVKSETAKSKPLQILNASYVFLQVAIFTRSTYQIRISYFHW